MGHAGDDGAMNTKSGTREKRWLKKSFFSGGFIQASYTRNQQNFDFFYNTNRLWAVPK